MTEQSGRGEKLSALGRRLAADGTWRYYFGFAIGRMSGLAVLPVLTRVLGISEFGRFEPALAALIAATIVIDAGLAAALVRFGDADRDPGTLLQAAARLQVRASVLAVLLVGPLVVLAAPSGTQRMLAVGALVVFAVVEGLATLGSGLCRATARDGVYLGLSVARFATTVTMTVLGAALFGSIGALYGIALGGLGFAVYAARAIARTRADDDPAVRRTLMRYGFPLVATSAMTWCLSASDRLFLQRHVPVHEVGDYAANYRLGSLLLVFVATPIALTWVPTARRATERGELGAVRRRWLLGFSLVAGSVVLGLTLLAPAFVPLFFGSEFTGDRLIVGLVGGGGWLGGLYYLAATPFLLDEDTRPLIAVSAVVIATNLVLNAALIPSRGGDGAAIAGALSYAGLCAATLLAARRRSG